MLKNDKHDDFFQGWTPIELIASTIIDISLEDLVELNQEFKRYVKALKANGIETATQMVDQYYACKLKDYRGLGKKFYGLIRDFITNQKSYREQYYEQHHEKDSSSYVEQQ